MGAPGLDSNGRAPDYETGALPTELRGAWWFRFDSNEGFPGYEPGALVL